MIEYMDSLMWLMLWPVVVYSSYRLILRNIKKYEEEK